jgi:hypothetical protein
MKMAKLGLLALGILLAGLAGFINLKYGTVRGRVIPPEGGNIVWMISATDTLKMPIEKGSFEILNVRPGSYRIIIEANPPYKNLSKTGIIVIDGQVMDLGEIVLMQ